MTETNLVPSAAPYSISKKPTPGQIKHYVKFSSNVKVRHQVSFHLSVIKNCTIRQFVSKLHSIATGSIAGLHSSIGGCGRLFSSDHSGRRSQQRAAGQSLSGEGGARCRPSPASPRGVGVPFGCAGERVATAASRKRPLFASGWGKSRCGISVSVGATDEGRAPIAVYARPSMNSSVFHRSCSSVAVCISVAGEQHSREPFCGGRKTFRLFG